jgi:hypothetical protein
MRRIAKWLAIGIGVLVVLAAIPVLWIETRCVGPVVAQSSAFKSQLPPADHRQEINSYLTYPEWSIVHAYEDLAAVMRASSESDYAYFGAIGRYWSSLCSISRLASSRDRISAEYKVLLYVIGLSFAGEMGVKGFYEKTLGRITAYLRGTQRTPEDEFELAVATDYAAFLRQTPWYEFPFGTRLVRFWAETPMTGGNILRKIERRIALTLEWGTKAIYARLMALGAAAAPSPLRIKSVVAGLSPADAAADPRIKVVSAVDGGGTIIETDRYRAFTEVLKGLAARNLTLKEIAGNQSILLTVLAPPGPAALPEGTAFLFEVPTATRPGWRRIALDVRIPALTEVIRRIERAGLVLEHVYDY